MELNELIYPIEEYFVLAPERKPDFAIMQIDNVDQEEDLQNDIAFVPFTRIWLKPLDALCEITGKKDVDYYVDLSFVASNNIDSGCVFYHDHGDDRRIILSEDVRIELRNYLDKACVDAYSFDVIGLLEQAKELAEKIYGKPDDPKIRCNRCTVSFTPRPKIEFEGDLQAVIFECPTCHKKYIATVSDSELRNEIERWANLNKEYANTDRGDEENERLRKELDELKEKNIQRGRELTKVFMKIKEDKKNAEEETASAD